MSFLKRTTWLALSLALVFQLCLTVTAENEGETPADPNEPLFTVACLTDLGRLADSFYTAEDTRRMLYTFSRQLGKNGKLDALIVGGDSSDKAMTEEMWRYSSKQVSEVLSEASDTVLYAVGNTDFVAGESGDYNSGDYFSTVMKDRLGTLYYWDFHYETYNGVRFPTAYRYYVGGAYFYFLNAAPTDMAGALHHGNFVYTQKAMSWIEDKMKTDDPKGDATMFLIAHFPPEGDGTKRGTLEETVSERLTQICTQHANLIYLYGNTGLASDTAETVTPFTDEGLVLVDKEEKSEGLGLSALWTIVSYGDDMIALQNVRNGKYLAVEDGIRLSFSDEPALWYTETDNGRVSFLAEDRVNGLRVSKSGTMGFTLGKATPMEVYIRSADSTGTVFTYSSHLAPGMDCAIVSDSKYVLSAAGQTAVTTEARVIGDHLVENQPKTTVDGTPGFSAVSMGTVENETIQYLTVTAYADRVELQLHNYQTDKGKTLSLAGFTRPNLPAPERVTLPSQPKPTEDNPFNIKLYLMIMAVTVLAGGAIGIFVTVRIGRHRFFE